jgi:protein tyrosine phosphatase
VYSEAFCKAYHQMLSGQVERRLRASVKMVADFWYSSWVDAGQPDLNSLLTFQFSKEEIEAMKEEKKKWELRHIHTRPHE